MSPDENLSVQQLSVLELLKSHIQSQKDAISALENKAQRNFTIINIIVAFVAALNLDIRDTESLHQLVSTRHLLTLVFVGYALVAILSLGALVIRTQATVPMKVSVKNAKDWSQCDLEHHCDILMRSYIDIYKHNERIVKLKGRRIQWAHTTIGFVIATIFVESLGLLPVISDFVLILWTVIRPIVENQMTSLVGTIFVSLLFATNLFVHSYLPFRKRVAASALVQLFPLSLNRFRRSK